MALRDVERCLAQGRMGTGWPRGNLPASASGVLDYTCESHSLPLNQSSLSHGFVLHGAQDKTSSLAQVRRVLSTVPHASQTQFRKAGGRQEEDFAAWYYYSITHSLADTKRTRQVF